MINLWTQPTSYYQDTPVLKVFLRRCIIAQIPNILLRLSSPPAEYLTTTLEQQPPAQFYRVCHYYLHLNRHEPKRGSPVEIQK